MDVQNMLGHIITIVLIIVLRFWISHKIDSRSPQQVRAIVVAQQL